MRSKKTFRVEFCIKEKPMVYNLCEGICYCDVEDFDCERDAINFINDICTSGIGFLIYCRLVTIEDFRPSSKFTESDFDRYKGKIIWE